MNEKKKNPSISAGDRAARDYVKYEADALMIYVFGSMVIIALTGLFFGSVILPASQKKYDRMRSELNGMAKAVRLFEEEHGRFPDSNDELNTVLFRIQGMEDKEIPLRDPWKRKYLFLKVSDKRAAVVSTGENGQLDAGLDLLSMPAENCMRDTEDEGIFELCGCADDDGIFVVNAFGTDAESLE